MCTGSCSTCRASSEEGQCARGSAGPPPPPRAAARPLPPPPAARAGFGRFQWLLLCYTGLAWLADACEVMLLSFLGPAARCEWGLSPGAESALSSVVFVGMLAGVSSLGALADAVGRRLGFLISAAVLGLAGLASAFAPSFAVSPGSCLAWCCVPARVCVCPCSPRLPRTRWTSTERCPHPPARPPAAVAAGNSLRGGVCAGGHTHRGHHLCRVCAFGGPRRMAAPHAGLLDGGVSAGPAGGSARGGCGLAAWVPRR